MRAYTVATAALALGTDEKWVDNLLSHHEVPGVAHAQRGVRRRIPPSSMRIIAIARALVADLSLPLHRAVALAIELETEEKSAFRISEHIVLHLDRVRMLSELARRLDEAAEFAAVPKRGRRPRQVNSSPT